MATTVNFLFVAAASITIVCSRIDDDDGKALNTVICRKKVQKLAHWLVSSKGY